MMFLFDLAFAVEILVLGLGGYFLIWAASHDGAGVALAKRMGHIIITLAVLGMICSIFYGTMYWYKGYFSGPMAMHNMKMQNCSGDSSSMMHQ